MVSPDTVYRSIHLMLTHTLSAEMSMQFRNRKHRMGVLFSRCEAAATAHTNKTTSFSTINNWPGILSAFLLLLLRLPLIATHFLFMLLCVGHDVNADVFSSHSCEIRRKKKPELTHNELRALGMMTQIVVYFLRLPTNSIAFACDYVNRVYDVVMH